MKKHIIFLAVIHLLIGIFVSVMLLVSHYSFVSSLSDVGGSVVGGEIFNRRGIYDKYTEFFGMYGITPLSNLVSLFNAVASVSFGYGVLKYKEWARLLGLVLAGVGLLAALYNFFEDAYSTTFFIQSALSAYMFWVLSSAAVREKCEASGEISV